jgi:ATP adenylyltransferase
MTKPLWAPWRLEYIQQADELPGCIFCAEAAGELAEDESLLVHRGDAALVILNKYPYS